jgi:hypothetical protein
MCPDFLSGQPSYPSIPNEFAVVSAYCTSRPPAPEAYAIAETSCLSFDCDNVNL